MWPETRSAHNVRKEMNVLDTHITVAIDGPSGAGKSTIARKSAEKFGFIYVDTGAIYRTVGLAAYRRGIASKDSAAVIAMLPESYAGRRQTLIERVRILLDAALRLQCPDGRFHDVLDDTDSFVEINCGQMFAYAIYRGVKAGWLDAGCLDAAERVYAAAR
mgnify:CR=1 FL=1